MTSINKRLSELRRILDLTQKEFADNLNIPLSTYKQYEKDGSTIPHQVLAMLSDKFNVSLDWFFTGLGYYLKDQTFLEIYFESKVAISSLESIFRRLYDLFNDKEGQVDILEVCNFLMKQTYNEIDLFEHLRKDKIPYGYLIHCSSIDHIPIEWILSGEYRGMSYSSKEILKLNDHKYTIDAKVHLNSNGLDELLKYAPPQFIEKLKTSLIGIKNITDKF